MKPPEGGEVAKPDYYATTKCENMSERQYQCHLGSIIKRKAPGRGGTQEAEDTTDGPGVSVTMPGNPSTSNSRPIYQPVRRNSSLFNKLCFGIY